MSTPEDMLELLRERFPKCFTRYPQPRRPLKIGIHKDVCAALAGVASRRILRQALAAYTSAAYREQLKPGAVRIDLAGEPAGEVTPEQVSPPSKPRARRGSHSPTPVAAKRLSLADLKAAGAARRATRDNH
jgi:sRNA-binding protein